MVTQEERQVLQAIWDFYLKKTGSYEEARAEICRLWITDVQVFLDKVTITAVHIGRLIGKRGKNIDALAKHLDRKVHLIEEEKLSWLIPLPADVDFPTEEHLA